MSKAAPQVPAPGAWGRPLLAVIGRPAPAGPGVAVSIEPGQVTGRVKAARGQGHRLRIRIADLGAERWARVVAALDADPSLLGAMLDGELPEPVAEAAGGRHGLLPRLADLSVSCSCLAPSGRCPERGAVWWEVAMAVDAAPATMLTLRGRSPEQLAGSVRREAALRDPGEDRGVPADDAYGRAPDALPPPPPLPERTPAGRRTERWTPSERSQLSDGLGLLVADAADRARDLLTGRGDGALHLSEAADLARRAARLERDPALLLMAQLTGVRAHTLTALARTWHRGGPAGVDVMYGRWSPPAESLEPGRQALTPYGRVWASQNRLCLDRHSLELRLGRDQLWYLVDVSGEGARLTGPPDPDPVKLVAARLGWARQEPQRPRGAKPATPIGEQLRLF